MILDFENRSFHQDRPSQISFQNFVYPSEPFSILDNRHFASHRPHVTKCWVEQMLYPPKTFFHFESGQFSQHRPQEVMQENATMLTTSN